MKNISNERKACSQASKQGFTLMELMVYCGLIGVIVMVAGQAYSDSVKFRVRSESMVKSSSEANAAATLLQEDLSQLGTKASFETGGSFRLDSNTYNGLSTNDTASFVLNAAHDSISFMRLLYDKAGLAQWRVRVTWKKDGTKLYRSCKAEEQINAAATIPPDCPEEGNTILIAQDSVTQFHLTPLKRIQDGVCSGTSCFNAPFRLISSNESGKIQLATQAVANTVSISGFSTNYGTSNDYISELFLLDADPTGSDLNPNWNSCRQFAFKANTTYALSFKILVPSTTSSPNYMRNFQAENDHFGVGFRTSSGAAISHVDDFLVYPAQKDEDSYRYMEFSFPSDTSACLVFTVGIYSPPPINGFVNISHLTLYPRDEAKFDSTGVVSNRQVKGFYMYLDVNTRGEITKIKRLIPTPNNGV